ncbi:MAG: CoA transferase [Dehalococcoidia bacterium]
MSDQALADVKVLDLTHYIAGPYCTKLLADYGADVIKVERPGSGDRARHIGPFHRDTPHPEKSGLFLNLNTNKRGITLNLKSRLGTRIALELVRWADVVVENFRPSILPRLGLGFSALEGVNPTIVLTSISNFGQTGPYRDLNAEEIVPYALSGLMYSSGLSQREPIKMGGNVLQYHAGATAALHTLIALQGSEIRGSGEHVDISILEIQASSVDRASSMLLAFQYTGESIPRGGHEGSSSRYVHQCRDGYINIYPGERFLTKALRMIGRPELIEDPRFATPEAQVQQENVEAFHGLFEPWLLEHTIEEAWVAAQKVRLLSGPLYNVAQLAADPNFSARGYWYEADRAFVGRLTHPGRPFIMGDTPWALRRPAPTLGEHNQEVYSGLLGYSRSGLVKLRELGIV